jgi:hypothetical protein
MEGNYDGLDDEASLYSCRPRAVDFDGVLQSSELGPLRNVGEETRTKITQKEFRGGGMIASITRVCYGTFKQKKAIIIVIQLLFHRSKDSHQFRILKLNSPLGHDTKGQEPMGTMADSRSSATSLLEEFTAFPTLTDKRGHIGLSSNAMFR